MQSTSQDGGVATAGPAKRIAPSDALVFFGATGDLAYKKIFPALQQMSRRGTLTVPVIGVAKSGWGIEQLRQRARNSLMQHGGGVDEVAFARLVGLLQYVDGDYHDAGKCLPATTTEVIVKLRQPPLMIQLATGDVNYVRFQLSPQISINLGAQVKRPGAAMVSMPVDLSAVEQIQGDEFDTYERQLGDAMRGDGLLFVRQDAVEAAWAIVDPILGSDTPLHAYEPGTWGPIEADQLATEIGGWHNPRLAS